MKPLLPRSADPETTKDPRRQPRSYDSLWCSAHGTMPWPFRSPQKWHRVLQMSTVARMPHYDFWRAGRNPAWIRAYAAVRRGVGALVQHVAHAPRQRARTEGLLHERRPGV